MLNIPSNIWYKTHQIPKLKNFSSCLAVAFAQSIEARWSVEYDDVVGAAPTCDALITSWFSTFILPTKFPIILEFWRYWKVGYVCSVAYPGLNTFCAWCCWGSIKYILVLFIFFSHKIGPNIIKIAFLEMMTSVSCIVNILLISWWRVEPGY